MSDSKSISNSKQIIVDLFNAFASRDEERIRQCFTLDAKWDAPPDNATSGAYGRPAGAASPAEIAHFIAVDFGRLFVSDIQRDVRMLLADGNIVVMEYRLQAKLVNGRHYDNDYCFIFEIRDGKVASMREYMDTQRGAKCIFGDEPIHELAELMSVDRRKEAMTPESWLDASG
jgi:ketosteroid isomerase-like protein